MSANSFKFLSIVYIREPGINKRKVIRKNTTKCRKYQTNLTIREYRIPLDVKLFNGYIDIYIFIIYAFYFRQLQLQNVLNLSRSMLKLAMSERLLLRLYR